MCRLRILGALHQSFTKLKSFCYVKQQLFITIIYLSDAYQITVIVNIRANVLGSYKNNITVISATRNSFR
jgi:hypothetical protein